MKLKNFAPQKNAAQAIVEFAIVLPLLLLLLYGILEAGRLLFIYSSVVTASRQAARYGSATGMGTDWGANGGPNNSTVPRYQDCYGIRNAARKADYLKSFQGVADIEIKFDGGGLPYTGDCDAETGTFAPTDNSSRIVVTVHGHFKSLVPKLIPFLDKTINATSARTILVAVSIEVASSGGGPAAPTINLTDSDPGGTQAGQFFTLTATLNGSAGTPAGTVDFSTPEDGVICTATLASGVGACTLSLPATRVVTATYHPADTNVYDSKTGSITHQVGPSETITTVYDTPDPSLPGGNVSITVVVSNKYGGSIPTGTVTVTTAAGSCDLTLGSAGAASCSVTYSAEGTTNIKADYSPGDPDHLASSGSESHVVSNTIPDTPVPPTVIPTTPAPPTPAPVVGCSYLRDNAGQITFSGKTMYVIVKNTANTYPVTVGSVFIAWNYSEGHTGGGSSALKLMKADMLVGSTSTVFWSSSTGINQSSALLPLSTSVVIPAGATAKFTFTFDQLYSNRSNEEQVQIAFSTYGCENYPVVRPAGMPTITPVAGPNLKVQLIRGGTDDTTGTQFRFTVKNIGTAAGTNISVRIYFQTDPSLTASNYGLEKISDDSGVAPGAATISGPTPLSGKVYYFTINYGTTSLPVGGVWTFWARLYDNSIPPSGKYSSSDDHWHTNAALPGGWTDWPTIPAYINSIKVWGSEP